MDTLTLKDVRTLMQRALGNDSFIAGIVTAVTATKTIPTACINAAGHMKYNPAFVRDHIKTEQDLFCLVFHEILHPAFGHFIHGHDPISNVACDAVINALITQFYAQASGRGSLFERCYDPQGLEAVLRPGSRLQNSRYEYLYRHLYPRWTRSDTLSSGEVVQTLRMLVPAGTVQPRLLGTHGDTSGEHTPEKLQGVAAEVAKHIRENNNCRGGQFDGLRSLVIEIMKTKRSIKHVLLMEYAIQKRLDSFFCEQCRQRRTVSPFPLNPSRRDLAMLGAGVWPGFFRNRHPCINRDRRGLAVFLDVSGSVNTHLPEICGLLARYRHNIRSVYEFSNAVTQIDMEELMAGQVATTYGTDFDCVAETLLAEGFEKAVVITDGCASLRADNRRRLREAQTRLLTILFGTHNSGDTLSEFGEVVRLDEITENKI